MNPCSSVMNRWLQNLFAISYIPSYWAVQSVGHSSSSSPFIARPSLACCEKILPYYLYSSIIYIRQVRRQKYWNDICTITNISNDEDSFWQGLPKYLFELIWVWINIKKHWKFWKCNTNAGQKKKSWIAFKGSSENTIYIDFWEVLVCRVVKQQHDGFNFIWEYKGCFPPLCMLLAQKINRLFTRVQLFFF